MVLIANNSKKGKRYKKLGQEIENYKKQLKKQEKQLEQEIEKQ